MRGLAIGELTRLSMLIKIAIEAFVKVWTELIELGVKTRKFEFLFEC